MHGRGRSFTIHPRIDNVGAVILAGGRNSRMGGTDKAFLRVDGQTVLQRALRVLYACFPQVVVVSNRPEKYVGFDVDVTSDEFRGRGPLAGLHAGLRAVRFPYAFVVACDMPFLRPDPICFLAERAQGQDAVIPYWEGDIEPLHAVYATRLRPSMGTALERGVSAIRDFLPGLSIDYVPEAVMSRIEGAQESFRNVNTPEDAARFAVQVGG